VLIAMAWWPDGRWVKWTGGRLTGSRELKAALAGHDLETDTAFAATAEALGASEVTMRFEFNPPTAHGGG
jgi:hypothetical protein